MAVANSDYIPDPFPGISAGTDTGAPGSSPDRTAPPDSVVPGGRTGLPGVGTVTALDLQAGPGESASTSQPGQTAASVIAPGPASDYSSPGPRPSSAHTDAWPREDWQQGPGPS